MASGCLSRPVKTVEPVVVMPDMVSKKASVKLMCSMRIIGNAANKPTESHVSEVTANASRGNRRNLSSRKPIISVAPVTATMRLDTRNGLHSASEAIRA